MPNAWDAGSATMIGAAGAKAIATTSAGISWALGRRDGQNLTRGEMIDAVARIVASVNLPVTADVEGGYGAAPEDVAETVREVIAAGAVGINLEDSQPTGALFSPAEQTARIAAARTAATTAGLPELFINARTDVYLFGIGEADGRFDDVTGRAKAYTAAGADGLFVPGLLELDTLTALVARVSVPINVMVGPGAPDVATLAEIGIGRVSLGQAIAQAAYTVAKKAAAEVLAAGTYGSIDDADGFGEINQTFTAL